mmetsp:Transcript_26568/g.68455  ORF Transcript_26568/g.68455 Transcript_26568/m.68455 type:complete len:186 (+) Transcript_26568:69-626(+)
MQAIWLDCDPGHDDAMAIILAGHTPGLELLGVSTVCGNQTTKKVTQNALSVLDAAGLSHIGLLRVRGGGGPGEAPDEASATVPRDPWRLWPGWTWIQRCSAAPQQTRSQAWQGCHCDVGGHQYEAPGAGRQDAREARLLRRPYQRRTAAAALPGSYRYGGLGLDGRSDGHGQHGPCGRVQHPNRP